jgi:hypothetical protein
VMGSRYLPAIIPCKHCYTTDTRDLKSSYRTWTGLRTWMAATLYWSCITGNTNEAELQLETGETSGQTCSLASSLRQSAVSDSSRAD